jgi:hypothetical protein
MSNYEYDDNDKNKIYIRFKNCVVTAHDITMLIEKLKKKKNTLDTIPESVTNAGSVIKNYFLKVLIRSDGDINCEYEELEKDNDNVY